ncbi:MAG: hypothetical protein LC777_11475 [Actinobacteria bacterium]|nr:hypothetical protein [Actinomycetota bacterium]
MVAGGPTASGAASHVLPPGTEETRTGLSKSERWLAALLIVAGFTITVVVLAIFLTDGKWLIEDSTTKGDGAAKTVSTKKYSDTLPLAAVAVGALLVLSGTFFGRLREVTVPGIATIKLWERQLGKVDRQVKKVAREGQVDPDEVDELKRIAHEKASTLLLKQLAAAPEPPPSEVLDDIAEQAVESAISETARRYDKIRAEMQPGGARDRDMEAALADAESAARAQKPTRDELMDWFQASEPGARIKLLGPVDN